MIRSLPGRAARLGDAARRLVRRTSARHRCPDDNGFVLLESIIAISLISVIMAAFASFFLNTVASTNQQRARQSATQLATSAVETIRGMHPSDLVTGHDATSVATQFGTASTVVQTWLASMVQATDTTSVPPPAAGSGAIAAIPTVSVAQTLNNVAYSTNSYLGWCWIVKDGSSTDCDLAAEPTGTEYLRAVVAVTWHDARCPAGTCTYLTATLVSTADDPTFNLNQTPPAVPVVTNPGPQTFAVGDAVSVQLGVATNTGVPTFTWAVTAGALPAGLGLNPAGLISGSLTAQVTNLSVTVTVTDAFLRTASATFTWTIQPPLLINDPGPQASVTGSAITTLAVSATGGSGTGYTWTDPTASLPPGLSLTTVSGTGRVNGAPTTTGSYSVQLTVTDSTLTRTDTVSFTWTITYPPIAVSNPGTQTSTVNTTIDPLQLRASGGSGSYTWTATGLPAGLDMSTSGLITGTPTAAGSTVTVTAKDAVGTTKQVTFAWAIVAKPNVAAPTTLSTTEGTTPPSIALAYTCPNHPCTITLNGTAPGLGLSTVIGGTGNNTTTSLSVSAASGTVYITGTVQGTAVVTGTSQGYTPSVTITDVDNAVVTSSAASWTLYAPPTTDPLAAFRTTETAVSSVPIDYTCPNTSCTITLTGTLIPGLGLSAVAVNTTNNITVSMAVGAGTGTFYIAGKVQTTAVTLGTSKTFAPVVTIEDVVNISTSTTATWTAFTIPTLNAVSNQSGTRGTADSVSLTFTCPNASCVATLTGAPGGLGLDLINTTAARNRDNTSEVSLTLVGTPFYINGKIGSAIAKSTYTLTVNVTDAAGVVATRSFTWTIS